MYLSDLIHSIVFEHSNFIHLFFPSHHLTPLPRSIPKGTWFQNHRKLASVGKTVQDLFTLYSGKVSCVAIIILKIINLTFSEINN